MCIPLVIAEVIFVPNKEDFGDVNLEIYVIEKKKHPHFLKQDGSTFPYLMIEVNIQSHNNLFVACMKSQPTR